MLDQVLSSHEATLASLGFFADNLAKEKNSANESQPSKPAISSFGLMNHIQQISRNFLKLIEAISKRKNRKNLSHSTAIKANLAHTLGRDSFNSSSFVPHHTAAPSSETSDSPSDGDERPKRLICTTILHLTTLCFCITHTASATSSLEAAK